MTNKEMVIKVREYLKIKLNTEEIYCLVNVELIYSHVIDDFSSNIKIYYDGGVFYTGSTFNKAFNKLKQSFNKDNKTQIVEIEE